MTTLRSPSTMQSSPSASERTIRAESHHHRETEPARHDRRMAGHASDREGDPAHVAVELDDVCRPEIRRNQNRVTAAARSAPTRRGRRTRAAMRADARLRTSAARAASSASPSMSSCVATASTSTRIALAAVRPAMSTALSTSVDAAPGPRPSSSRRRGCPPPRSGLRLEASRRAPRAPAPIGPARRGPAPPQPGRAASSRTVPSILAARRRGAAPFRTLSPVTPERQRALARSFKECSLPSVPGRG